MSKLTCYYKMLLGNIWCLLSVYPFMKSSASRMLAFCSALIGNPRRVVQLDLLKSHGHLKCSCCSRNGTAVSGSWRDTSIICNLAQEYGDVINVHDWYISFEGIVNSTNSKVKRKSYSSPSNKKSKSTPPRVKR